jgi:hypothetical protein
MPLLGLLQGLQKNAMPLESWWTQPYVLKYLLSPFRALASVQATLGGTTSQTEGDVEMAEAKEEPQNVLPSTTVEEVDVLFKTYAALSQRMGIILMSIKTICIS